MTTESGSANVDTQEENPQEENPQDEKQRMFGLGESSAKQWAIQARNTLESKKGEWVYNMELFEVAGDPYASSGMDKEGFGEGFFEQLKKEGIEVREGNDEERNRGMGGNWFRVKAEV